MSKEVISPIDIRYSLFNIRYSILFSSQVQAQQGFVGGLGKIYFVADAAAIGITEAELIAYSQFGNTQYGIIHPVRHSQPYQVFDPQARVHMHFKYLPALPPEKYGWLPFELFTERSR